MANQAKATQNIKIQIPALIFYFLRIVFQSFDRLNFSFTPSPQPLFFSPERRYDVSSEKIYFSLNVKAGELKNEVFCFGNS